MRLRPRPRGSGRRWPTTPLASESTHPSFDGFCSTITMSDAGLDCITHDRRRISSSNFHVSQLAFCCISSAVIATTPALAALLDPNVTPVYVNTRWASGVVGMFALDDRLAAFLHKHSCVARGHLVLRTR